MKVCSVVIRVDLSEQLWRHLAELGVNRDDRNHPAFGDVRQLIEGKFVRSLYISRTRNEQQQWEYKKGPRGKAEIPRLNLVSFLYKVCSDWVYRE